MRTLASLSAFLMGCVGPPAPTPAVIKPLPRPSVTSTISYEPCVPGKESVIGSARFRGKIRVPCGSFGQGQLGACESHDPLQVARAEFSAGPGGEVANVFIAVTAGVDRGLDEQPTDPIRMTHWCIFLEPRVVVLRTGQSLVLRNGEKRLHSISMRSVLQPQFGRGQVTPESETRLGFAKPEVGIRLYCDIHAWERAWVHVVDYPFFAVTDVDGKYSIKELPPGEYEILAWHDRFQAKPLFSKVKVEAGKTTTLDFTFEEARK